MSTSDLVIEADIAAEYGESGYTWRNRRLAGEGPPFFKLPGKRTGVYYSRQDVAEYYKLFRTVPVITARRMEEIAPAVRPVVPTSKRGRSRKKGSHATEVVPAA